MDVPVEHPLLPVRLDVDAVVHEDHYHPRHPEADRRRDHGVRSVDLERTPVRMESPEPVHQPIRSSINMPWMGIHSMVCISVSYF